MIIKGNPVISEMISLIVSNLSLSLAHSYLKLKMLMPFLLRLENFYILFRKDTGQNETNRTADQAFLRLHCTLRAPHPDHRLPRRLYDQIR